MVQEIHPMWPIEEYANILRILICFRPPHAPTITDRTEHNMTSSDSINDLSFAMRNSGAIFCQQAIIIPLLNVNPLRTSGNQKWHGAKPSFITRANVIIEWTKGFLVDDISHFPFIQRFSVAPLSNRAALKAWTKKYFRVASLPRDQVLSLRIGSSDRVLNSRPNHIGNQCFEVITNSVPDVNVSIRNNITIRFIGFKRSLTSLV